MKGLSPPKLETILRILPANWMLSSHRRWAMGWVADIDARPRCFQLVSDRGYIDVYEIIDGKQKQVFPPEDQRTHITPEQVSVLLMKAAA
jgi:hypothetical protein